MDDENRRAAWGPLPREAYPGYFTMYLNHFNLQHKPFQISTDPRFLWMGEKHKEAFATLKYGVLDNKGFLLLTGDVGTGKTTLINALLKVLGNDVIVATVRDPVLNKRDFFNYIARAFGMAKQEFESKGDFLNHFTSFLNDSYYRGKRVLLIIDEAQKLKQELLEEVRLLSNIEHEDAKLLNIFFVGQNEFNSILHRPANGALRQRITVQYNIQPFTEEEAGEYIRHRLKVAGGAAPLFQPKAIREVYLFSRGYPRLINIVCDRAMLTGFVREAKTIDAGIVKECAEELRIPDPGRRQKAEASPNGPAGGTTPGGDAPARGRAAPRQGFWNTVLAVGVLTCLIMTILLGVYVFLFRGESFRWRAAAYTPPPRPAPVSSAGIVGGAPPSVRQPEAVAGSGKEKSGESSGGKGSVAKPVTVPEPAPVVETVPEPVPAAAAAPDRATAPPFPPEKIVVPFGHDSILPSTESLDSLNLLAKQLLDNAKARIIIRGYSDSSGNERYNQRLSEFRANAVKGYLVAKGISESRMTAIGAGEAASQAQDSGQSGASAKRKVEIEVAAE